MRKTERKSLRLESGLVARIDAARGRENFNSYIERMLEQLHPATDGPEGGEPALPPTPLPKVAPRRVA